MKGIGQDEVVIEGGFYTEPLFIKPVWSDGVATIIYGDGTTVSGRILAGEERSAFLKMRAEFRERNQQTVDEPLDPPSDDMWPDDGNRVSPLVSFLHAVTTPEARVVSYELSRAEKRLRWHKRRARELEVVVKYLRRRAKETDTPDDRFRNRVEFELAMNDV